MSPFDLEGLKSDLIQINKKLEAENIWDNPVLQHRANNVDVEVLAEGLGQAVVGGQGVAGRQGDLEQFAGRELARAHAHRDLGAPGVAREIATDAGAQLLLL